MKNFFIENLDVVDHTMNEDLEKVASIVSDLRDNAKKAYIPSYEEQQSRQDKDFAVVMYHPKYGQLKKFACYNEDLTELNIAFLIDKKEELPDELLKVAATNLVASANKFGIPVPEELQDFASKKYCDRQVDMSKIDLAKYASKLKEHTKKASVKPTAFALNNKYPIHTKENIEKAAEWFGNNYTKLSVDEQREFITNVKSESEKQNAPLEKTAMANFVKLDEESFNQELFLHVNARKALLKEDDDEMVGNYNDLLRRADEIGPVKVAYVLEALDKEAGLDYYYDKNLVDPLRASLGIKKLAGRIIDGVQVTKEQLKKVASDELTEVVGNDVIKELRGEDSIDVLASLPRPIRAQVLEKLK